MTQINDLNNSSLGDLTDALADHSNVVDFSWLENTPGDTKDNHPSDSLREIIPQLQSQWSRDLSNSPNKLIPGQKALVENKDKTVSPEDKIEVERVAKKAMMQGISGKDLVLHLRERFSSEQIDASAENLRKVAQEDGLLGNVYLDLSAFNTTKEALQTLGNHKIRLASYVIGAPIRESKYIDQTGKCLHLAKTVVDQVEYTSELISHYASHLKNIGAIPFDMAIENKEMLRSAFLQARYKKHASPVAPAAPVATQEPAKQILSDKEIQEFKASAGQMDQGARLSMVRPLLAKIQGMMQAGAIDEDLKQGIRSCCDEQTIKEFSPEISGLVSRQGLIGPVVSDASYYGDVGSAVSAISQSPVKPMFLIGTLPSPEGFLNNVSVKTGIPVMASAADFTHEHASRIVANMHGAGQLDTDTAHGLLRMASEKASTPSTIVKMASKAKGKPFDKATKIDKKETSAAPGFLSSRIKGNKDGEKAEKREGLKNKAKEALDKGISSTSVQAKLASFVPVGEAIGIMREALAAMDVIDVKALDECGTQRYALKKNASLVMASKCSTCVFQSCGACSKQARPFRMASVKKASEATPFSNPVAEMGLVAGSMDLDLAGVIIPARRPSGIDVTLPGASFGKMRI
jgi:hypothetical protein